MLVWDPPKSGVHPVIPLTKHMLVCNMNFILTKVPAFIVLVTLYLRSFFDCDGC